MNSGRVAAGAILLMVAIWVFVTMTDITARYLGGAILAILGLALLIKGSKSD